MQSIASILKWLKALQICIHVFMHVQGNTIEYSITIQNLRAHKLELKTLAYHKLIGSLANFTNNFSNCYMVV